MLGGGRYIKRFFHLVTLKAVLESSSPICQVIFKPRLPLGIFVSDLHLGRVSGVFDGQAKEQGLEAPGDPEIWKASRPLGRRVGSFWRV